jgi:hypothetical protein
MGGDDASDFRIRHHAAELLGRGALTAAELVEQLHGMGVTVGRRGADRVGEVLDEFIEVSDER